MIHYIEAAIRIEYDPKLLPHVLAVTRKRMLETIEIPVNDDPKDETCRPMTQAEVEEEVVELQDCIDELLRMNPIFEQLNLEIIASVVDTPRAVRNIRAMPARISVTDGGGNAERPPRVTKGGRLGLSSQNASKKEKYF